MEAHVRPRAAFVRVECACGNQQPVFSRVSSVVKCTGCGETLAEPTGGNAKFHGEIVEKLE